MDRTIGHDPKPNGSGTYHVMTNDQIKIDGDRASATTKWIYVTPGKNNTPTLVFLGRYLDEFVRETADGSSCARRGAQLPRADGQSPARSATRAAPGYSREQPGCLVARVLVDRAFGTAHVHLARPRLDPRVGIVDRERIMDRIVAACA